MIGLLSAVKNGKETKYFVNKEYRDNVKLFTENIARNTMFLLILFME